MKRALLIATVIIIVITCLSLLEYFLIAKALILLKEAISFQDIFAAMQ